MKRLLLLLGVSIFGATSLVLIGSGSTASAIPTDDGTGGSLTAKVNGKIITAPDAQTAAILRTAFAQNGKPYVWGAEGPKKFDCSGLIYYAYSKHGPYNFERMTAQQYFDMVRDRKSMKFVKSSHRQVGDLVFFGSGSNNIDHIGIYIGHGQLFHAANPSAGVKVSQVSDQPYDYVKYARL